MMKGFRTAALAVGVSFCAPAAAWAAPVNVVASFSILADMTRAVGGEDVAVTALVGPDGDAHVYQPTPADAKALAGAGLVVVNGLGFEGWIDRLIKSSGYKGPVTVASTGAKLLKGADSHAHNHKDGQDHGAVDPHAWQSVANAQVYADNILAGLTAAAPDKAEALKARHSAYRAQLQVLEEEIKAGFAAVPPKERKIVTTHDAFAYFGKAYGVIFMSATGVSTESEASAGDVARLIRQIKKEKVKAVFVENISDPRLVQRIAAESGATLGPKVYSDALSAAGDAATYVGMMRSNAKAFSAALTAKN
jgi:zinc/manganese transport system substrate-binding protein